MILIRIITRDLRMRAISPIATFLSASLALPLGRTRAGAAAAHGAAEATGRSKRPRHVEVAGRPAAHARGSRGLARRIHPYALARGNIAGGIVVVVKDGQVLLQKGYGYADVEKRKPVDPGADAVPPGLGLEALHLDRRHAAGRARQARPRRRRQPVPRLQDSAGPGWRAAHDARPHDPHAGLRGGGQGTDFRGSERASCRSGDAEELGAGTHLQGRHDARLLELRDRPRRLHRRARLGPVVRRLSRPEHLRAARHGALLVPPAAAEAAAGRHGAGLRECHRQAQGLRAHQPRARGLARGDRCRHGAVHDRAPAEWRLRRRAHPLRGNREEDARHAAHDHSQRQPDGPGLLRDRHQRPPHHLARRRHAVFPQRPAPVHR